MLKYSYKKILITAAVIHLVTAILSVGFLHPDEYYYGLNFMFSKLDILSNDSLKSSWEYTSQIRPWSLPYLLLVLSSPLKIFGVVNPHLYSLWLRIVVGAFSLFSAHLFAKWAENFYNDEKLKKLSYLFQLILWPVIFMHVRLSSDNIATAIFLFIPYFLFSKSRRDLVIAGSLIGITFSIRHQMGILGLSLGLFALLTKRVSFKHFIIFIIPGILFYVGLGILLDFTGYKEVTFTPYNYLYQNIIVGKMATFGSSPWWNYFKLTAIKISPTFGIPLIFFVLRYFSRKNFNVLFWAIVPFFVFHSLLSHKELRFLYPILPFAMIVMVKEMGTFKESIFLKLSKFILITNFIVLPFACFRAANTPVKLYQWLYSNDMKTITILPDRKGRFFGFQLPVLLPSGFSSSTSKSLDLKTIYLASNISDFQKLLDRNCILRYSTYPLWLIKQNPFNFTDKSNIISVFDCVNH